MFLTRHDIPGFREIDHGSYTEQNYCGCSLSDLHDFQHGVAIDDSYDDGVTEDYFLSGHGDDSTEYDEFADCADY